MSLLNPFSGASILESVGLLPESNEVKSDEGAQSFASICTEQYGL